MQIFLSNTAPTEDLQNLDCLSNEFAIASDDSGGPTDWLKIPYGDIPHAQGVIQRFTRPSAETIVANFKTISSRLGRLFGGDPIYIGHPDDPALANQYPDKKAYGWIKAMEARDDGLYLAPKWGDAGKHLLSNAHFKWFSPYWGCRPIPGATANGRKLVEPVRIVSLGLTNNPNIPGLAPLANESNLEGVAPSTPASTNDLAQPTPQGEPDPMREALIAALALDPAATDEQILAAVAALKTAKDASATSEADAKTARATAEQLANEAQTALKTERKARIELILSNAIAAGKITAAQRPQWASDLEKDLDAKLVELSNAKSAINTASQTANLGARNANVTAARDAITRRDRVLMLVNERITKTGEDYESAFANIRKEHTALFAEMQTPKQ